MRPPLRRKRIST